MLYLGWLSLRTKLSGQDVGALSSGDAVLESNNTRVGVVARLALQVNEHNRISHAMARFRQEQEHVALLMKSAEIPGILTLADINRKLFEESGRRT